MTAATMEAKATRARAAYHANLAADQAMLVSEVEHLMGWRPYRDGRRLAERLGYYHPFGLYKRLVRAGRPDLAEQLQAGARESAEDRCSEYGMARLERWRKRI